MTRVCGGAGNPGCGKTSVARLLATAMEELGYRQEGKFVETSAQAILKFQDPPAEFEALVRCGETSVRASSGFRV